MATSHQEPNYMMVFFALTILTVIEIAVVFLPISKLIIGVSLVLMALAKAALVALYFMHLRYEKIGLGVIALIPLVICALLIFALLPDLTGVDHKTQGSMEKSAQVETVEQVASTSE